jgi:tripartite-type tricarboxylate transporter receptor subunit TctC
MKDLGYSLLIDSPVGLAGPARLPPDVVATLHDAFKFAIEQPSMIEVLDRADARIRYMDSATLTQFAATSAQEQRELLERYGLAVKK